MEEINETKNIMQNFLKGIKAKWQDFDFDFIGVGQQTEIEFFCKIEKFFSNLEADLILANTSDEKVYLIGVAWSSSATG